MYSRQVEGQPEPLTFGVSGKLIMNVLVMYDRETGSYWSQILGEAVEGELTGTTLEPLAALQTNWEAWKTLHPDTLALDKGTTNSYDSYSSYYAQDVAGVIGETRSDDRLNRKALGLGMVIDGAPAFFPYTTLRTDLVVNDRVGDVDVVVAYENDAFSAVAYDRSVDGQTLTFSADGATPAGSGLVLVDAETGSRWSALTGAATAGPLAGTALERIPATSSFWFGWKDWHPDTYLYGHAGE